MGRQLNIFSKFIVTLTASEVEDLGVICQYLPLGLIVAKLVSNHSEYLPLFFFYYESNKYT